MAAGITFDDAHALRRISMTLHRWHEIECGDNSGCVKRDETTGKPYYVCQTSIVLPPKRFPIADREAGALKRLAKIIAKYPNLQPYVQGDSRRGAALYILRPGDVPEGAEPDSYYNRGIAVYK
jgi:hypothetical protein